MELEPIGRVENPDDLDFEPIVIPVVGYTRKGKEVLHKAQFRSVAPAGQTVAVLRNMAPSGGVPAAQMMTFLDACVLAEDREAWNAFLDNSEVEIEQSTLVRVYAALMETYAARPTMPPGDSSGTGKTTKQTSRAASRSRASRSRKSPSRSRST
jgi:hypothetical protein